MSVASADDGAIRLARYPLRSGSGAEAVLGNLDAHWRRLTDAGNQAFAEHDDATALRLYLEALTEAERLFDLALAAGGAPVLLAPMVHTIACQNAAEAKRRTGDVGGSCDLKLHAIDKLIATAESATTPIALRANCVRHLKYALAGLDEKLAESDSDDSGPRAFVSRAQAVRLEVIRVVGHVIATDRLDEAGPHRHGDGRSMPS